MSTAVGTALLQVEELWAGYGPIQVLHGVTFEVNLGEVVVILGANGAGKTTTLRAICQMINTRGRVDLVHHVLVGAPPPPWCGGASPTCLKGGARSPS
jgi:branched-chain amino acid transport system ATP-binding protein